MICKPPVEELVKILGNRYVLCCLVAKRARQLADVPVNYEDKTREKPLTAAAIEAHTGKLTFTAD